VPIVLEVPGPVVAMVVLIDPVVVVDVLVVGAPPVPLGDEGVLESEHAMPMTAATRASAVRPAEGGRRIAFVNDMFRFSFAGDLRGATSPQTAVSLALEKDRHRTISHESSS
jgi:hypothetical protein